MESHLDPSGGFSFRLACVFYELASSMLSTGLKKALSFRAVELGLRLPQSGEQFPEVSGKQGAEVVVDWSATCSSGASPRTCPLVPVEATQHVLVERIKERIAVQIVDFPVEGKSGSGGAHCRPSRAAGRGRNLRRRQIHTPGEHHEGHRRTECRCPNAPRIFSQEHHEVVRSKKCERVQRRIDEKIVEVPVPQIWERNR